MKKNKTVLITIFFLFCVFIIAFFIRVLPAIQYSFLSGDKVLFHDTDPYYHMRRITYFLNHNFQLPEFDYYLNYPEGGVSFWPSGFAKLAAYFSYVFNKGNITKYGVEYAACWLPPILGALTVIPVWFFGRILFGNAAGLLAALFFAFQPYHISYSMLGKIDHHVAETFSAFIIYISFALIMKKLIFISDNLNLKDLFIKLTPCSLFAAITIWFAYMMWTGATLYLIPCFLTAFLLVFLLSKKKLIPFAFVMAECGLFALALIFYPSITSYWGRLGLFNHDAFSLLHIFIFSVFTLFYSGIFILTSKIIRISKIRMFYAKCFYCLIFGAFLFLIVKIFLPQSYSGIMEGVKLLMKQGEAPYHIWLTTISEYSPLLSVENGFEIIRLQYALTGFIYFVPFGLLAILICIYKNSVEKSPDLILFFIISVLMGLMAVKQSRYCYIFGVNVSILGAYSLVLISELLSQSNIRVSIKNKFIISIFDFFKQKLPLKKYPDFSLRNIFIVCVSVFLFFRFGWFASQFIATPSKPILSESDYNALIWIKNNTPPTDGFENPPAMPEYGIMNFWDWGHFIAYVAERPPAANPYGMGIERMINYYLSKSEEEGNRYLNQYKCRYVLTFDPLYLVESLRKLSMRFPGETYKLLKFEGFRFRIPKEEFLQIMGAKLHLHDGSKPYIPDLDIEGLKRYRLIYESDEVSQMKYMGGPGTTSKIKLFEYVKGARFAGKTSPGKDVEVRRLVRTNVGREFLYRNSYKADANGYYELILPYTADDTFVYAVLTESDSIILNKVNENDVLNGNYIKK